LPPRCLPSRSSPEAFDFIARLPRTGSLR
jgi:hypothetical protein